jgi:feruloyl-CoA synthase
VTTVVRDPALLFPKPDVQLEKRADGSMLLRSRMPLGEYPRCIGVSLEHWAKAAPDRQFLLERNAAGQWCGVSYGVALQRVRRIAGGQLQRGASAEKPVMILSDNGVDHGLMMLAAMHVGVPSVSVSVAYSLMSKDFAKLRRIVELVAPRIILVADSKRFAGALAAIAPLHRADVVVTDAGKAGDELSLAGLETDANAADVDRACQSVNPDTVAKLLFTSGSTDEPKGVINTQRMMCSNQQARAQDWPFLMQSPPIMLDWLPWSHTFGGNHNFNLALHFGGTLYIDGGRPAPPLIGQTCANIKDVCPTIYFNVPRGYDMLIAAMRNDAELRERFFSRLQVILYAAAALPQNLWDALTEMAVATVGTQVPLVSAWGSTETAPLVTDCHFQAERAGVIGVPAPGSELKLVRSGDKLEVRIKGPNITPGYWKRPDLTASHFDEEGYYKIGDAVKFADADHPERGLLFDGRVAEDFKLDSGTWVNVGMLRIRAVAALAPVAQDIVIAGHDRASIGFLIIPNVPACRQLCPDLPADVPVETVLSHTKVRARVVASMNALRSEGGGSSSTSATVALLMAEPLSIDGGEITDKGYVNQRAVLTRRADLVRQLYGAADNLVIRIQ